MPELSHRRRNYFLLAAFLVLLLSSAVGEASVRTVSLSELVERSDQIVVGKVSRVHRVSGLAIAEVAVSETLKGAVPVPVLYFLAQPTWICDVTEAEAGETDLLFLTSANESLEIQELPPGDGDFKKAPRSFHKKLDRLRGDAPFFLVAHAGRGRMPLRPVADEEMATVWTSDVRFPEHVTTLPGPEPEYSFIRSVPFATLRELVLNAVRTSGNERSE